IAANLSGVLHGAAAAPQSPVPEFGGAATVGAVVLASSRPALAQRRGALRASADRVSNDQSRAPGGETGLAAGLSLGHRGMEPVARGDPSGGPAGPSPGHRPGFRRGIAAAV